MIPIRCSAFSKKPALGRFHPAVLPVSSPVLAQGLKSRYILLFHKYYGFFIDGKIK